MSLAQLGLLGMVEPLDFDNHVAAPGFPHAFNAANVWQMWSSSRQEDSAVTDAQSLLAPYNCLVEQFPCFPFHATALQEKDRERLVNSGLHDTHTGSSFFHAASPQEVTQGILMGHYGNKAP